MRFIDTIILHCSDTPNDMDIGVQTIDTWHRERGWNGCGYHFVVRRSGAIEIGRELERMGAHCYGYNRKSIGICMVGRDAFSPAQHKAAFFLVSILSRAYGIQKVLGHRDFNNKKTCPNFDVRKWYVNMCLENERV